MDLFLVLSAFLFVKLLEKEYNQTGSISIVKFYIRRGLRIYPLYFIFCLIMVALSAFLGTANFLSLRALGLFTFTDNIMSARWGYNPIIFSGHLWTISYEEQFYLIIPLLLLFLFRSTRSRVVNFLSFSALVLVIVRGIFIHLEIPNPAIWVLPVTHFESIFLGIVIGLGGFDFIFTKVWPLLVLIGGLFFGFLMTRLGPLNIISWKLMIEYPLVGLSTSLIVYFILRTGKARWMKWLSFGPFVFLGKVSYGLYVYHVLGIYLGRNLVLHFLQTEHFHNLIIFMASLVITVAIASVSYLVIERPALRLKKHFEIIASRPA